MAKTTTKELLKDLDKRIEKVQNSKQFKKILESFSKFHNYSYQNNILIHMQKPNATFVAGYKQWEDKFNRHVKKGENGIAILAPYTYKKKETKIKTVEIDGEFVEKEVEETVKKTYFKTVYVFDVSQTKGEQLPTIDTSLENKKSDLLKLLKKFSYTEEIKVKTKTLSGTLKGYSDGGKIVLNNNTNNTEKASILVHELAHELLHNKKDRRNLNKEVKEMEAESVSFIVMNHFGIKTKSDKYLALYKKSYDLEESLFRIKKISSKIISFCDDWIQNK